MTQMTHDPGSRHAAAINAAVQAEPDAAHVAAHQAELAGEMSNLTPVPVQGLVHTARADTGTYRTMVLQGAQARQLLPQDPQRFMAYVMAIDYPIILCDNKDLATSPDNSTTNIPYPQGAYLPTGIMVPILNKGLCWAVNTNANTATRIFTLVERYENAQPHGH